MWKLLELIVTALVALGAAYGGARHAFKLQNDKAEEESKRKDVQAANSAIFALMRAFNKLTEVRKQFLDEHRGKPDRHLHVKPIYGLRWNGLEINYESLSFTFDSNEPNFLGTLSILEQDIGGILELLKERAVIYEDHLEPALERLFSEFGNYVTSEQVELALGTRFATKLQTSTDFIYEQIDELLPVCREHLHKLSAITLKMYPGFRVINMSVPTEAPPRTEGQPVDEQAVDAPITCTSVIAQIR